MTERVWRGGSQAPVCSKYVKSYLELGHKVSPYRPDLTAWKNRIKELAEKQLTYRG